MVLCDAGLLRGDLALEPVDRLEGLVVEGIEARRELAELGQGQEAGAGKFDGWALWVASFVLALHKNWAKITPYLARR